MPSPVNNQLCRGTISISQNNNTGIAANHPSGTGWYPANTTQDAEMRIECVEAFFFHNQILASTNRNINIIRIVDATNVTLFNFVWQRYIRLRCDFVDSSNVSHRLQIDNPFGFTAPPDRWIHVILCSDPTTQTWQFSVGSTGVSSSGGANTTPEFMPYPSRDVGTWNGGAGTLMVCRRASTEPVLVGFSTDIDTGGIDNNGRNVPGGIACMRFWGATMDETGGPGSLEDYRDEFIETIGINGGQTLDNRLFHGFRLNEPAQSAAAAYGDAGLQLFSGGGTFNELGLNGTDASGFGTSPITTVGGGGGDVTFSNIANPADAVSSTTTPGPQIDVQKEFASDNGVPPAQSSVGTVNILVGREFSGTATATSSIPDPPNEPILRKTKFFTNLAGPADAVSSTTTPGPQIDVARPFVATGTATSSVPNDIALIGAPWSLEFLVQAGPFAADSSVGVVTLDVQIDLTATADAFSGVQAVTVLDVTRPLVQLSNDTTAAVDTAISDGLPAPTLVFSVVDFSGTATAISSSGNNFEAVLLATAPEIWWRLDETPAFAAGTFGNSGSEATHTASVESGGNPSFLFQDPGVTPATASGGGTSLRSVINTAFVESDTNAAGMPNEINGQYSIGISLNLQGMSGPRALCMKRDTTFGMVWSLGLVGSQQPQFQRRIDSGGLLTLGPAGSLDPDPSFNYWIVATFSQAAGRGMRLYTNGVNVANAGVFNNPNNNQETDTIDLFKDNNSNSGTGVRIDDFMFWDRELTDLEISDIFSQWQLGGVEFDVTTGLANTGNPADAVSSASLPTLIVQGDVPLSNNTTAAVDTAISSTDNLTHLTFTNLDLVAVRVGIFDSVSDSTPLPELLRTRQYTVPAAADALSDALPDATLIFLGSNVPLSNNNTAATDTAISTASASLTTLLPFSGSSDAVSSTAGAGQVNLWEFQKEIGYNASRVSGGSHLDEAMAFHITDLDLRTVANGGKVRSASGFDIQFFADAEGTAPMKMELVRYNATTGEYKAWIAYPTLSAGGSVPTWMRIGNVGQTADPSDTSTSGIFNKKWVEGRDGVIWHLEEDHADAAPEFKDSLGTGKDGTAGSGFPTVTDSQIASQLGFGIERLTSAGGGNVQVVGTAANPIWDYGFTGDFTISFWFKCSGLGVGNEQYLVTFFNDQNGFRMGVEWNNVSGFVETVWFESGVKNVLNWGPLDLSTDTDWHHYLVFRNGQFLFNYLDGVNVGFDFSSSPQGLIPNVGLGALGRPQTGINAPLGIMDEVRFLPSAGVEAVFITEFNNQTNPTDTGPDAFWTVGVLETLDVPQSGTILLVTRGFVADASATSSAGPDPTLLVSRPFAGTAQATSSAAAAQIDVLREFSGTATAISSVPNTIPLTVGTTAETLIDEVESIVAPLCLLEDYLSLLDIWNTALIRLGVETLTTTNDSSSQATLLTRAWPLFKKKFLEDNVWDGAKTTATLTRFQNTVVPGDVSPPDRWTYAYNLPGAPKAWLRSMRVNGKENRPGSKGTTFGLWEEEVVTNDNSVNQRCLVTDEATVNLEYIFLVDDNDLATFLSADTQWAMGVALAAHVASNFGRSPTDIARLTGEAEAAVRAARRTDAQTGSKPMLSDFSLLESRL